MRDLYSHERIPGSEGVPIIQAPEKPAQISRIGLFRRRCFLLGITDRETQDQLWVEEEAKRALRKAQKKGGVRGGRLNKQRP